ncbi:hypothetical protein CEP53_000638 [Fusarium sp. AF-6]|nr:hypothetical protein CEP53_000638 [Fusarium sp. AF-6]
MANMLRTPLRRNVTSALVRAQTTSSLRTFQAPAQILIQQRARIHEKTPDQQQPQTQSKETRKNPQSPPKQAESSKTQSKQKKDAKGGENKSVNSDRDDLDDIKHILLVQAIADLIHGTTHEFCD